jgi:hypothetical protein
VSTTGATVFHHTGDRVEDGIGQMGGGAAASVRGSATAATAGAAVRLTGATAAEEGLGRPVVDRLVRGSDPRRLA